MFYFFQSLHKQIHHIEINYWVVCPPSWYESILSTTLRKVLPVKEYWGEKLSIGSSWANSEWFFLIKNGWMDHQCRISWKFISDVYRFVHFNLTPSFKLVLLYVGWVLGELPKLHMWAQEDCWWVLDRGRWNWKYIPTAWSILHYHPTTSEHINCYIDSSDLRHQLGFFFPRSQDTSIYNQIFEHETTLRLFNFFPSRKETSMSCMTAFAMFFSSMVWWTSAFPSKTSTPKEWVAQRGTRGVGWPLAMLNLASLQSQAVGHGQHAPNGWRYELDTRKGVWKSTEMHTNGWYET